MVTKLTTLNNQQDIPYHGQDIYLSKGARYNEEFIYQIETEYVFGLDSEESPQYTWYDLPTNSAGLKVQEKPYTAYEAMLIKLAYSSAILEITHSGEVLTLHPNEYSIELRNCSIVLNFSSKFTAKLPVTKEITYKLVLVSSGFDYRDLGFTGDDLANFVLYYSTMLNLYPVGYKDIIMSGRIICKGVVTQWL